jgi:hypothetical protein
VYFLRDFFFLVQESSNKGIWVLIDGISVEKERMDGFLS